MACSPPPPASSEPPAKRPGRVRGFRSRRQFRNLFLSDLHLGCSGALAEPLAHLLERIECRKLYLVGDIIDMWQLRRRWLWNDCCDQIVGRLVEMAKTPGCEVIVIAGNHDAAARRYADAHIAGIEI